jgi:multiple sugar transport system substrate-binding protein
MKRILASCAALMLCIALSATAAQAAKSKRTVTELTFATYVWQPSTVKAMNDIVAAWNKANPSIQVKIVPVDVNSVHDKLLTSFVGGTAADIVHDEAADIPGFTQQGYLANLRPLLSKELKQAIPASIWDTVNFGGKITGVPIMLQTYNVFANMDIFKAAGIKAPTVKSPWTWQQFQQNAIKLTKDGNYGVCWGLRSPTATIQTLSLNWGGQWNYLQNGKWVLKVGPAEQQVLRSCTR